MLHLTNIEDISQNKKDISFLSYLLLLKVVLSMFLKINPKFLPFNLVGMLMAPFPLRHRQCTKFPKYFAEYSSESIFTTL